MAYFKRKKQDGPNGTYTTTTRQEAKPLTPEQAWPRLLRFCAFQERAPSEVKRKMVGFGLAESDQEELLIRLAAENYLAPARFATSFVSGKLSQNRWGAVKIKIALQAKGIDKEQIAESISATDPATWQATLRTLLEKRDASRYHALPPYERYNKLFRLGLSHGFESDLVKQEVKRITGATTASDEME
jgi:regulatory protein